MRLGVCIPSVESWRCHQMETFSALLALCVGNSLVTGEFSSQTPLMQSFDVFFDLRLNKWLVNNQDAGDLGCHHIHYDITVMFLSTAVLTHWGRVMHICVVKQTIIGSYNGLLPGWRQAIIYTNAGILIIGPLGTNFSEILIGIKTFSLKKMHLKMSSAKWHPFSLGLNVLRAMGKTMVNIQYFWRSCFGMFVSIYTPVYQTAMMKLVLMY